MENNSDAKQLIIDRVKQATNILVTVENNPSVDELAAALALTLMLNKMDKHATAVFSGAVPPAINFLEPAKTFENTVDSLRDFIIALDKEKADRLRYKVEDDVVKIFITPYQSTITEKDLQFSQGDFNVEVVIALGVEKRESLDRAIAAHGRILHDATVVTINARDEHSNLGAVDWQDGKASSICEMLVGLADTLQPKMLDTQISTALLTGIVAATGRFGNEHTTPHAMTLAAELMAAGANQQLIANNLQQAQTPKAPSAPEEAEGKINREPAKKEGDISEDSKKVEKPVEPPVDGSKGEMKVRHDEPEEGEEPPKEEAPAALPAPAPAQSKEEDSAAAIPTAADEFSDLKNALQSAASKPQPRPPMSPEATSTSPTPPQAEEAPNQAPVLEELTPPKITPLGQNLDSTHSRANWDRLEPPTLGGTLNATSAEAEESRRREAEEEAKHNHVTLSHGGGAAPSSPSGMPNRTLLPPEPSTPTDYIASPPPPPSNPTPAMPPAPANNLPPLPPIQQQPAPGPAAPATPPTSPPPAVTKAERAENEKNQSIKDLEDARRAVSDALTGQPFDPASQPTAGVGAQPLPESTPPASSPQEQQPPTTPPAPQPPTPPAGANGLPPLPDFNTLPPLPPLPGAPADVAGVMQPSTVPPGTDVTAQFAPPPLPGTPAPGTPLPPAQQPPSAPAPGQVNSDPNNPNQFRIPGQ